MKTAISIVTLGVSDLQRSVRFYETGLGFVRIPYESADIAFFEAGTVTLALYPRAALAADAGVSASGSGFQGITLAQIVGSSSEVMSLLSRAQDAGGRLVKAGQPVSWGGFSGYFADPDGFLWEIACDSVTYQRELGA
jgi:catechol 2,3-dioxygenase-like lactoylglutathione lyase family enzyme